MTNQNNRMIKIGDKIRELRKKGGIRQTDLSDYLGVSYSTVKSWEKNKTEPKLSYVEPLAKVLGVTTEFLIGTGKLSPDEQYERLKNEYEETFRTGDQERRKEICKMAARMYPSDNWWHWQNNLIRSKNTQNYIENECEETEEADREIDRLKNMIEESKDPVKRWENLAMIARLLCNSGRKSEALHYIRMLPESPPPSQDDLVDDFFDGCLLFSCQQKRLNDSFSKTLWDLYSSPEANAETDRIIINLISAMIPDGNYLEYHRLLYLVKKRRVKYLITRGGTRDEILTLLEEMHTHSVEYDHIFTSPDALLYTVDHMRFVSAHALFQGGSLRKDFKKYLKRKSFDPFRQEARFVDLVLKGAYM
ncbi:MAG: helix-turn-helix transcriptional regulator [Clostridia bacterium]|nr:helix-turn-helix transcriptional regulator [Clostridia bacterium]